MISVAVPAHLDMHVEYFHLSNLSNHDAHTRCIIILAFAVPAHLDMHVLYFQRTWICNDSFHRGCMQCNYLVLVSYFKPLVSVAGPTHLYMHVVRYISSVHPRKILGTGLQG